MTLQTERTRKARPAKKPAPAAAPRRLANSLLLIQSIVENIPDMIFVKDATHLRFVLFNKAAEDLLGYSRENLIGKSDYDFFTRKEADFFIKMDREVLRRGALLDIPEEPIHTRRKGIRILHTKKIPILDRSGKARFLLGVSEDVTDQKRLEKEVLRISEREHRRIGQDLHDGLGQQLTGIAFLAEVLAATLKDRGLPEAEDAARLARLVSEAVTHARDLAGLLYPLTLETRGLPSALHELATHTREALGSACDFLCPVPVPRQDKDIEGHLFRIAQEGVSNAVRHGRVKRIVIELTSKGRRLFLRVMDDGRGYPARSVATGGMGMTIMRYRARMMKGTISFERGALGGASILCSVPGAPTPPTVARSVLRPGS
jgi:PAS domain S-box-containing protein